MPKDIYTRKNNWLRSIERTHNGKYDYTSVDYINANVTVEIVCPRHGSFFKSPSKHKDGSGCTLCNLTVHLTNDIVDQRLFVADRKIKRIGNVVNSKTHIIWKCLDTTCGSTWQSSPDNILNKKRGCPHCAGNRKLTTAAIVRRLMFQNKNVRRISEYINIDTPTTWECLDCNKQYITSLSSVLHNHCPNCNTGGVPSDPLINGSIYLLRFTAKDYTEQFLKVGITKNSISYRFGGMYKNYNIDELYISEMSLCEAYKIEQNIIKEMGSRKYYPRNKFGGYTECFIDTQSVETDIKKLMFL